MDLYRAISHCRVCKEGRLDEVMNFGEQYLASNFVKSNEDHPLSKVKVPLTVGLCEHCGLLQLGESVNRDLLFRDYFYRSGTNPMMRAALKDVVEDVTRNIDLREGDYILDIGCNDCTMLSLFSDRYRRIGIDPAQNVNRNSVDRSITVVSDFFSKKAVMEMTGDSPCRVVTSIAMLYGVEDLNAFASEVESILAPDGVWCIQLSYLPEIINNLSFYDVCHEHLYYFSLHTLTELMERNGLVIFDASVNDVNGGSLRVFATHGENPRKKTGGYHRVLGAEEKMRLSDKKTYEDFFEQVCELKKVMTNYIRCETERGAQIIGLGASTKGNVLLQFFDIDKQHLPYISERNPEKVALRTLGTDIEIISEEKARELNPDAMLVLIWFFKDEVIRREREYLDRGGKLLFPMPYCHIVTSEGEQRL